ncbi:prepilin-type N-terminal cleavage/methylation domain-containing protein [Candidatus Saccharibacteria bacterium]|nr:prepilin-type N-terminal cleavage/methylation domain-containing protein [Candidatus Saccharibacteria bacterium]
MKRMGSGFTIVELLIVIVVIAILAAISIAAYVSISDKANDSAVMSDLSNFGKKIELKKVEQGTVPSATTTDLRNIGINVAKQAYATDLIIPGYSISYNMLYCKTADSTNFAIVAWSKSGKAFVYTGGRVSPFTGNFASRLVVCPAIGMSNSTNDNVWLFSGTWQI